MEKVLIGHLLLYSFVSVTKVSHRSYHLLVEVFLEGREILFV